MKRRIGESANRRKSDSIGYRPLVHSPGRRFENLLLAIDVGNTHVTIGVFKDTSLLRTWRLHTNAQATADELGLLLAGLLKQATRQGDTVQGVVLASVVPALDQPLFQAAQLYLHQTPVVVGNGAKLGIQ